tara:strand:+ start:1470 stop:1733 length:264 start_codon:yes stop_codon:yes gene_type:complete
MDREDIEAFVEEVAPGETVTIPDNLDDAFVGVAADMEPPVAIYSIPRIIEVLKKEGMSATEAVEYFQYNVMGSLGEGHPIYVETFEG